MGVFLTASGWGKKMSYCIAFSIDGATDVTRRYVRNAADHGAERNRCPEEVTMWIMKEIQKMRRENMKKDDQRRLAYDDQREEKELRGFVVSALAASIGRLLPPGTDGQQRPGSGGDEIKLPARRSGAQAWREARHEAGEQPREGGNGDPRDRSPREGH